MSSKKNLIVKGVKFMGISILLMFLAPVLISIGFRALNDGVYFWMVIGVIVAIIAIILAFLGIKTIMSGLFEDDE